MAKLIAAVSRRINPSGVKELTIRQYGAEQLEIIIPEIEESEVDQIKKRISTSGLLEFRIVANENDDRGLIKHGRQDARPRRLHGRQPGRPLGQGRAPKWWPSAAPHLRQTKAGGHEILARIDLYDVDRRLSGPRRSDVRRRGPDLRSSFIVQARRGREVRPIDQPQPARLGHWLSPPAGHHPR